MDIQSSVGTYISRPEFLFHRNFIFPQIKFFFIPWELYIFSEKISFISGHVIFIILNPKGQFYPMKTLLLLQDKNSFMSRRYFIFPDRFSCFFLRVWQFQFYPKCHENSHSMIDSPGQEIFISSQGSK